MNKTIRISKLIYNLRQMKTNNRALTELADPQFRDGYTCAVDTLIGALEKNILDNSPFHVDENSSEDSK